MHDADRRDARGCSTRARRRDDRRDLPADRAAGALLRRGRRPHAVQLPAALDALGARARSRAGRAVRGGAAAGAWPNWVLGNHDRCRVASRVGPAQARVAAMLLLTLRGTPTIYYGDEIGMTDVPIPPERVQDPWELNCPGSASAATRRARRCSGSAARTPASARGAEPWLPLGDLASNVAAQGARPALDAHALPRRCSRCAASRRRALPHGVGRRPQPSSMAAVTAGPSRSTSPTSPSRCRCGAASVSAPTPTGPMSCAPPKEWSSKSTRRG